MIENILIVDDEKSIRFFLEELLSSHGFQTLCAKDALEASSLIKKNNFDLIISDMNIPKGSGLDVIRAAKKHSPSTQIIVITAYGTIENAVEAMQQGAFNYLTKPFSHEALLSFIKKAEEQQRLINENTFLKSEAFQYNSPHPLIAESTSMKALLAHAQKAADSNANIFIHGESGCGKEVLSQFIHQNSPRSNFPYIKVNCAAIPETLMESEFFGHEKGAFTGASIKKAGRFELADKGTLLLDEITEIPPSLQVKLLRAIQEKEFEHLGGTKTLSVDVRILATSNRNIKEAIEEKNFRQDLYYRLNVIPIHIPPLRERTEDILPLANFFVAKFCKANGKEYSSLSKEIKSALLAYPWPGNIRELSNVIERAVILGSTSELCPESLSLIS